MRTHKCRSVCSTAIVVWSLTQSLFADQAFWATDNSDSWTTGSNWSHLPLVGTTSPLSSEDVTIDRGAADPVVTLSNAASNIRSLVANEALVISSGTLGLNAAPGSPQSAFNSSFTLDGGTLSLVGANTTLNILGPTPKVVGMILVSSNATLNWLSSNSYVGPDSGNLSIQLTSHGQLDMSHVTSFSAGGANGTNNGMSVNAIGGTFDLSGVGSITSGHTNLAAQSNGQILLNNLTTLNDDHGTLFAFSDGLVNAPKLNTLNNAGLWLGGNGQINAPLLNNIDGSSLTVQSGGTLAVPLVTSYFGPATGGILMRAYDAGSLLDMSHVTSFSGSSTGNGGTNLLALGGTVDVSALGAISSGETFIQSIGATSLVKLDSLTTFTGSGSLRALQGGTINAPLLTTANDVQIELDAKAAVSVLNVPSLAQIDRSSVKVESGAVLALPLVTSYELPSTTPAIFEANGSGSKLVFANLTSITAPIPSADPGVSMLQIQAYSGTEVSLPAVQTINAGELSVFAESNSTVRLDNLTAANGVSFNTYSGGTIVAPKLTTFTNGRLSKSSPNAFDTSHLQNIDGTSISADSVPIDLPLITTYAVTAGYSNISAVGPGAVVNLSNLTSITGDAGSLYIYASNGGQVDLSNLQTMASATISPGPGAPIAIDRLTTITHGGFSIFDTGQFIAPQLTQVTRGEIDADGRDNPDNMELERVHAPLLTHLDGTSIATGGYAKMSFPGVTSYDGLDIDTVIVVSNGFLNFPNLVHFKGSDSPNGTTICFFGGSIDFTSVTEFSGGKTLIDGSGSPDDEHIRLNPGTTTMKNVTIQNESDLLTGGTIDLQSGSQLNGRGNLAMNVINSAGTVAPGFNDYNDSLTIDGTFTQTAGGHLKIDFVSGSGPAPFDHLQITGQTQLGGVLDLQLGPDFHPAVDDEFRILDAASLSGKFALTTGFTIDSNLRLAPFVDATGVTMRVVLSGDANLDHQVDGADYVAWADHFLKTGNDYTQGDFNNDGIVDGADYTVWADHFLKSPSSLTFNAVPEPSTLALAGIGALALLAHRLSR